MTKKEIQQIMESAYRLSPTQQWRTAIGKFNKLEGKQLPIVLVGLTRYIKACQKLGTPIDSATFNEIFEDAKQERYVWEVVNEDRTQVECAKNNGQRGGSYRAKTVRFFGIE